MGQILLTLISLLFFSTALRAELRRDLPVPAAIYGKDERQFVSSSTIPTVKRLSESVAMIVQKDELQANFLKVLIKADLLSDKNLVNLCLDQKFAGHHSLNSCTGFLIAPDLMASAGHCFMSEDDCRNKVIVFGVTEKTETSNGYKVFKQSVYSCKEIVKSAFDADAMTDFAVIRLNKEVSGRAPLRLRQKGEISKGDSVFMIGHPLGLPLVYSPGAKVNDVSEASFFKATLDSFEGNSGSPVFNSKTLEVEGLLVRGEEDFEQKASAQCMSYKSYDENAGLGESVTKIKEIL